MKKIMILSLLLTGTMIACKKKKDETADPANQAPTVSITAPSHNGESQYMEVEIAASASDSDGSVSRVDFYDGNTLLGSDQTAPYSYTASLALGSHTLKAKAVDNDNAETTSATVTFTITPAVAQPETPAMVH